MQCHLSNIQKVLQSNTVWLQIQVGNSWQREMETFPQKGRSECGPGRCPLLEGSRRTPDTSASLKCGPPTGDKQDRLACQCSDRHLRHWITVGKEQTPHLAGPAQTSQNEQAAAKPL